LKSSGFNDLHDSIFDAMDQPSIDGMNSYLVSKVVAERGIKVALSGLGGDELLAGYSTFESVPLVRRLPHGQRLGTWVSHRFGAAFQVSHVAQVCWPIRIGYRYRIGLHGEIARRIFLERIGSPLA
jgi:asparagine synthetase B (glutamine-hydrolysing)